MGTKKIYIEKKLFSYEERVAAGLGVDMYRSQLKAVVEQHKNITTAAELVPFIVKGVGGLYVATPNNYFSISFEHLAAYVENMSWGKNNLHIKFDDCSEIQGGFDDGGAFVYLID